MISFCDCATKISENSTRSNQKHLKSGRIKWPSNHCVPCRQTTWLQNPDFPVLHDHWWWHYNSPVLGAHSRRIPFLQSILGFQLSPPWGEQKWWIKINQFANLDIRLISISFVLVQGLLPPPNSTSASASTKRRERTAKRVIASCTTWFPCIHTRKRFIVRGWWKPAGSIHNIAWWMRSLSLSLSLVCRYTYNCILWNVHDHQNILYTILNYIECTYTY